MQNQIMIGNLIKKVMKEKMKSAVKQLELEEEIPWTLSMKMKQDWVWTLLQKKNLLSYCTKPIAHIEGLIRRRETVSNYCLTINLW